MQVAARAAQDDFLVDETAQRGCDRRSRRSPHSGVANEGDVGFQGLGVPREKGGQRRRTRLLLAFEQGGPPNFLKARHASRKVVSWPLSSDAPRATIRSPRGPASSFGSNGGLRQRSSGSTGCTS